MAYSPMDYSNVRSVIVGGAGNVGKGIFQACCRRSEWTVIGVDPGFQQNQSLETHVKTIKSTIEDIDDEIFKSWFQINEKEQSSAHVEVVVTNDIGNRDTYAIDPIISARNDARFQSLMQRIAATRDSINNRQTVNGNNGKLSVHISYIGGSWTRRQPSQDSQGLIVEDTSPAKEGGGSNPYEIAKSEAEMNARQLSEKYGISITFYDYISVVPNFEPNFSVNRMIKSGLEYGIIKYSEGEYGRPLLHSTEAGEFVARIVEEKKNVLRDYKNVDTVLYETILVPGYFVKFRTFADIAKETIENKRNDNKIVFETYDNTPDELRKRCKSSRHIVDDSSLSLVIDGLRETAIFSLKTAE